MQFHCGSGNGLPLVTAAGFRSHDLEALLARLPHSPSSTHLNKVGFGPGFVAAPGAIDRERASNFVTIFGTSPEAPFMSYNSSQSVELSSLSRHYKQRKQLYV